MNLGRVLDQIGLENDCKREEVSLEYNDTHSRQLWFLYDIKTLQWKDIKLASDSKHEHEHSKRHDFLIAISVTYFRVSVQDTIHETYLQSTHYWSFTLNHYNVSLADHKTYQLFYIFRRTKTQPKTLPTVSFIHTGGLRKVSTYRFSEVKVSNHLNSWDRFSEAKVTPEEANERNFGNDGGKEKEECEEMGKATGRTWSSPTYHLACHLGRCRFPGAGVAGEGTCQMILDSLTVAFGNSVPRRGDKSNQSDIRSERSDIGDQRKYTALESRPTVQQLNLMPMALHAEGGIRSLCRRLSISCNSFWKKKPHL